jgi:hypothetical protein
MLIRVSALAWVFLRDPHVAFGVGLRRMALAPGSGNVRRAEKSWEHSPLGRTQ